MKFCVIILGMAIIGHLLYIAQNAIYEQARLCKNKTADFQND